MNRCKICYKEYCSSEQCIRAIHQTRERVLKQLEQFNKVMGTGNEIRRECKESGCHEVIIHPKQLCEPCRKKRKDAQKRTYRAKQMKKPRYCKKCNKSLEGLGNSVKYCSDECRPRKQVTARSLVKGEREPMFKPKKESGINPMFTNPRGSKMRRAMGLDEVKFSNNTNGGYSVVE